MQGATRLNSELYLEIHASAILDIMITVLPSVLHAIINVELVVQVRRIVTLAQQAPIGSQLLRVALVAQDTTITG